MGVQMGCVVMKTVGEADRISRMELLRESPHDFLQARVQDMIGIQTGQNEGIMLFLRH